MRGFATAATLGLLVLNAGTARAQNNDDHLTCYKIKDPVALKATADLSSATLGVSSGCTVSKAALLCMPSHLSSVATSTPVLRLGGPRTPGERICYKIKCPTSPPASADVTDAFGTRTMTGLKTSLVCTPAAPSGVMQHGGFDHYARGLAQLSETTTANGPTLHVESLAGTDTLPDAARSSTSDPGGGGVVVVLQNVSSFGVRVRDDRKSTANLGNSNLRVGSVLSIRGHGGQNSDSMMEALTVEAGNSGVSSTAYFPRLARTAGAAPLRTGTVTCAGAPAGSASETTSGDPKWTWFSQVWPDRYETSSDASTDSATFYWENGCVSILSADNSGTAFVGDKLVISVDNGSSPLPLHRLDITGAGGLREFALKEEVSH